MNKCIFFNADIGSPGIIATMDAGKLSMIRPKNQMAMEKSLLLRHSRVGGNDGKFVKNSFYDAIKLKETK